MMTPEQTVAVIEVMNVVGTETICDIEHNDDYMRVMLDENQSIKIWPDGHWAWYQHDELHRDDGPAVLWTDGSQQWWQHGKLHRENGPAVIYADRYHIWCQNGKIHREDGPANVRANGDQEWWLNGTKLSKRKHARMINRISQ